MEFLVRVDVDWPADMSLEERTRLKAIEADRRRVLMRDGVMKRLWRVPGKPASLALYEAPDATALHELLAAMPLWPWFRATVEPLATHPLEAEADALRGGAAGSGRGAGGR